MKEVLFENIREFIQAEFFAFVGKNTAHKAIAIWQEHEKYCVTICYQEDKFVELEGYSLSDLLHKWEQISGLLEYVINNTKEL